MKKNIIYIQSHPIQYFAPFFENFQNSEITLTVLFCSKEGLEESYDVEFGKNVKWDIPLLNGYESKFIKNNSKKPTIHNRFFGLLNWGIIKELKLAENSIVIVPGWNYASYWLAIFAAKYYGHKLGLRGESPFNQEIIKSKLKLFLRKLFFKIFLFNIIDYAFYIGKQNKLFYEYYGVSEDKLYFVPYSVDNKRFQMAKDLYFNQKNHLKKILKLDDNKIQILFSGKYIQKKRPLDLLNAFSKIDNRNLQLVMVGDGELRQEMEDFIIENNLTSKVFLTGFINQTEIVKYYATSDIFVMCSGIGETWGLSVNEAMNFGLKLIVSKTAGCSIDLVQINKTGWIFETGNIDDLADKIIISAFLSKK